MAIELFIIFLYCLLMSVGTVVKTLLSDVSNLRLLSFFLISLTRVLSVDLSIGSAFGFFDLSLFIFIDSCSAAAKSLQSCPTLRDPMDCSPQAPPSLGFSRQEHWSGVPSPSPTCALIFIKFIISSLLFGLLLPYLSFCFLCH